MTLSGVTFLYYFKTGPYRLALVKDLKSDIYEGLGDIDLPF
jgi:hypothetical protein